jgi:hypothetical protein
MTAHDLAHRIRELHHQVPQLLTGEVAPEEFWGWVEAWFREVATMVRALEGQIPGEETIQHSLAALREGIRWDLDLNRTLFPVLQSREPQDTIVHHAFSIFGIMSAEILDRLFSRLTVLVEILGLLDGSIDFPEETYLTYQELRAMIQGNFFPSYADDDLDA